MYSLFPFLRDIPQYGAQHHEWSIKEALRWAVTHTHDEHDIDSLTIMCPFAQIVQIRRC